MKKSLPITILLTPTFIFLIWFTNTKTYKPDLSKGKTAIWDYGYGEFGGGFQSFKKNKDKRGVVSFSDNLHGIFQNASRKDVNASTGLVWKQGAVIMHPGKYIKDHTKIKFTAPSEGTYAVSAKWTSIDKQAKKTWAWVYTNAEDAGGKFQKGALDGYNKVFSKGIDGYDKSIKYKKTFTMKKGEVITFEVGNGLDGWEDDSLEAEIEIKKIDDDSSAGGVLRVGGRHPKGGTVIFLAANGRSGWVASDEIKNVCMTNVVKKVAELGRGWQAPTLANLETMAKALPTNESYFRYMSTTHKSGNYYWGLNMRSKRKIPIYRNDCKTATRAVKKF